MLDGTELFMLDMQVASKQLYIHFGCFDFLMIQYAFEREDVAAIHQVFFGESMSECMARALNALHVGRVAIASNHYTDATRSK